MSFECSISYDVVKQYYDAMNSHDQKMQFACMTRQVVLTTFRVVKHNEAGLEEMHSLRSSIWKFLDGRWQMVFHQGTPTMESEKYLENK